MNRHSVWSWANRVVILGGRKMGSVARAFAVLAAIGAIALLAPIASTPATGGPVRAGAAAVDASWHVGASAGQYASDGSFVGAHGVDPTTHSYRKSASYGIQSRLSARAIVVEGADGQRMALVKNDLYIPQDLLYRRTAQMLEQGDSGIDRANLTMAVTHDHSSPYYSSTSWGAWAFQDVFDVRFFDYYAQRMAQAVEEAAGEPDAGPHRRLGQQFDKTHRHSYRPGGRRRRHPRRLPERGHRPRPDRGPLRRHLGPGPPEAARQPRQLQPPPGVPRRQRPDLAPTTWRRCSGWSTARPAALTIFTQNAVGHRRAGAQHLPLDPRAARVHPPRVRAGRVRAPA